MTNFRRKKRNSFTLLEVMLALSIVSVLLLIIARAFSQIIGANISVANYTEAMFLAQEQYYMAATDARISSNGQGRFGPPFERFSWSVKQASLSGARPVAIDVVVSWQESGRPRIFQLSTYHFRDGVSEQK